MTSKNHTPLRYTFKVYYNPDTFTKRPPEPHPIDVLGSRRGNATKPNSQRFEVNSVDCNGINVEHLKPKERLALQDILQSLLEEATGVRVTGLKKEVFG